jgi:hypothetical protein
VAFPEYGFPEAARLGNLGRILTPDGVDQAVARDGLIRMEQKNSEQRALLAAAERERPAVQPNLDGPKDSELHARLAKHCCKAISRFLQHVRGTVASLTRITGGEVDA